MKFAGCAIIDYNDHQEKIGKVGSGKCNHVVFELKRLANIQYKNILNTPSILFGANQHSNFTSYPVSKHFIID